ncbi:hypothetical protein Taro_022037 [Colocasia esculenta]|uniref:Uncharacterized protein n=1 Tax=Colocasia esculenta TaxID=4460 RepID=A0A843V468_COLES|nr:hypothetical protein [Colocasia esculenta]
MQMGPHAVAPWTPHRGEWGRAQGSIPGYAWVCTSDGAKCGGVILFGPKPNGPPLERTGKTDAGADGSLQDQKWIRGPSEDRGNPPMPKSVESL